MDPPVTPDEAFLQAIIESPDDDAPRLVYADWLDEHGQPERAEFIRAQCALARMPEDDPQAKTLRERERALLAAHAEGWLGPLRGWFKGSGFRRGFVETAGIDAATLIEHAEELFRRAPLRRLTVRAKGEHLAGLIALPQLAGLRSLNLCWASLGEGGAELLAACPHLAPLTELILAHNRLGDAGAGALAKSAHLTRLEVLSLSGNDIGPEGASALAASPALARLRDLILASNPLGDRGAAALAASPHLAGLRELELSVNRLTDAGARALAGSPSLRHLAYLGLSGDVLGPAGAHALAAGDWPDLTELDLTFAGLGDEGARALAASPGLRRLTRLQLGGNGVGDAGARALLGSPYLRQLELLDLTTRRESLTAAISPEVRAALKARFGQGVFLGRSPGDD